MQAQLDRIEEKLDMIGLKLGIQLDTGGAASTAAGDPYFANVVSLLHFDGNLTDVTGKTWTASGNAAATGTAKYGSNSLAVDGNGDWISTPDSADWAFGTGNWTVELWAYPTAVGQAVNSIICEQATSAAVYAPFLIAQANGGYNAIFFISTALSTWNANALVMGAMTANDWNHLALVRDGATIRSFVNGVAGATYNISTTSMPDSANTMLVGGGNYASSYFTGRIDDFRVTKGVARYTANFTPPTAAFPDTYATWDPYFANVVSLLHFDGNLTDVTGKTWTPAGNAAATGTAKYGSNSLTLDGSGDYLQSDDSTDLTLSADFTVECWINTANTATLNQTICSTRWYSVSGQWFVILNHTAGTGTLRLFHSSYSTTVPLLSAAHGLTSSVYFHFALTRSGNTYTMWVGGSSIASVTGAYSISFPIACIGDVFGVSYNALGNYWNGQIDDFRVTKGVARYTANFTPPTAAFPDSA